MLQKHIFVTSCNVFAYCCKKQQFMQKSRFFVIFTNFRENSIFFRFFEKMHNMHQHDINLCHAITCNTCIHVIHMLYICIHVNTCVNMLCIACIALHCIAQHCNTLHCIAQHCIALHCIALNALHCIALHCIAAIHYGGSTDLPGLFNPFTAI